MTRFSRVWFPLFFFVVADLAVCAQDYIYVTNSDHTLTITEYVGPGGDVSIPSNIADQAVASIGALAFFSQYYLTSIAIPDSVTNIEGSAFALCGNLTNAIIGNQVAAIADDAFFSCTRLLSIAVADGNPAYGSWNGVLFDKAQRKLIRFPGGRAGRYAIPDGVAEIGPWAFNDCNFLTYVQFPDSVTKIGFSAFSCCVSLSSVTIGGGVTQIEGGAFGFCTRLVTVMIQDNNIASLGDYVFENCWDLQGVYFSSNAPAADWVASTFVDSSPTIFYLPGTTGWGSTFAGRPTALWQIPIDAPAVQEDGFEFRITGPDSHAAVLEVCTNLASGIWTPMATNTLLNGYAHFNDPTWTNHPSRYFRIPAPH